MTKEEAAILRRYLPKTMLALDAAQTLIRIMELDNSVEYTRSVRGINNGRIHRFSRAVEAGVTQAHVNLADALDKLGGIPLLSIETTLSSKVKP